MKGIQNCLLFFPICSQLEMSQRTHVACDRHAALEATCFLGYMSSRQCEPFLLPPVSFHVSVHACLLRDIATTCRVRYVEGSVNAALEFVPPRLCVSIIYQETSLLFLRNSLSYLFTYSYFQDILKEDLFVGSGS